MPLAHLPTYPPCRTGKDPTNIGSLRDSVNWGDDDDKKKNAVPKARGLVKDTVDPRLRASVNKK